MPRTAYVNGRFVPHCEASVHIEDRGFQFADSVYEVIGCINGDMADMRGHLDRLERSLKELRIVMPVRRAVFPSLIKELLRRNKLRNAAVYIQVSRGAAPRDFKFPSDEPLPTLVITARPFAFDAKPVSKKGIKVITLPDQRWARRDIKTTNLLPSVLAKQAAAEAGAGEAWMIDGEGNITEGSSSNAWIVTKDGKLVTRNATHAILKGVTRTAILPILKDSNLELEERAFTPKEAYEAVEAFTSSATSLIMPVLEIDGHPVGDGKIGPVTTRIYNAYRDYVRGKRGAHVGWEV